MATGYQSIPHEGTWRDPNTVTHCEACGEPGTYGDPAMGATLALTRSLVTDSGQPAVVCFGCAMMASLVARAISAGMGDPFASLDESEPLAN